MAAAYFLFLNKILFKFCESIDLYNCTGANKHGALLIPIAV